MADVLGAAASVAEIVTAVTALGASAWVLCRARVRVARLEAYLASEKASAESLGRGRGMRTSLHLMGNLAMTEAQVLESAFASRNIKSWVAADDESGRAECLFFEYQKNAH